MINGLQVVCHLPFFNVKTPGNVNTFNVFFSEIVSFNLIDTEFIDSMLFYFPEMDPISLNFQDAGFMNNFMIPGLGALLYMMIA